MTKLKMVCETCGSEDVLADAYAKWNTELQMWEVEVLHDKDAFCNTCEELTRIDEVAL
jgi:hypothetical protein